MDGQVQLLRQPVNDEIDLVELARTLWQQKLLILFCAVAVSAIAALYAFTATPYYRVQSILRPTPIKELDALNQSGVYKLNPDAALQRMGIALESYANRLEFFRTHPDLFVELQQPNLTLEQSFERFNRDAFTVLKPDAKKDTSMGRYVGIAMSYPAGVQGPEALNGLVDYVIDLERQKIADDVEIVIQNRLALIETQIAAGRASYEAAKQSQIAALLEQDGVKRAMLQDELKALRLQLKARRENRIQQLNEAIQIARQLNIVKPTTPSALGEAAREVQGNLIRTEVNSQQAPLYFMGVEALDAERSALLKRKSDDFTEPRIAEIEKELRLLSTNRTVESLRNRTDEDLFLKKLAQWREEAAQLKQLNLDIGRVRLVTVDQVAIEPTKAEKPRKALILALGLVLGGMLGLFVALVRGMLRRLTPR